MKRSESDFAETILQNFFDSRLSSPVPLLTAIISLESFLKRPLPNNLVNTILTEILKNKHVEEKFRIKTAPSQNWKKLMVSNTVLKPFLSVSKNETDKEILGRLLCGVPLYLEKDKQNMFGDRI